MPWHQNKDFETFNGAVLMTTNCIIPIKKTNSCADRLFTTGAVGYPGAVHIPDRKNNAPKDFSGVIARAKQCQPPEEIETGTIVGGFGHNQALTLADKVIEAVKSGAIKRFIVMAGCDGRMKNRSYFTEVAQNLPKDTLILTAGLSYRRSASPATALTRRAIFTSSWMMWSTFTTKSLPSLALNW